MATEEDIINHLTKSVTENVSQLIRSSLSEIVQQEISKALARALFEGEFYRGVNSEVSIGIENIVSEISSFKKNLTAASSQESVGLLGGSASILDEIIDSTEKATLNILDLLDQMQLVLSQAKDSARPGTGASDGFPFESIESIITSILTELSFQDLTGQQIRMVINSLKRVENLVFEIHLTSEALKKTKLKSPDKNLQQLKEEARELVRDFKTQGDTFGQSEIDTLFEQHGL